jgi:DNA-binding transcriptional LysR family regulator
MDRDLEVRQCRVLLAVADAGGVGAAARVLGVAQSTVSETLLSLERLIGAPVTVRRPGRGATLTAAAKSLLPHARLIVSASQAALTAIAREGREAIRLGAVESISSFLLPAPLSAFRRHWPHVDVQVTLGLCEELRARVDRHELDAALTVETAPSHRVERRTETLSSTRLLLIVSPRHPLNHSVASRRDLGGQSLLLADHDGAFNATLKAWLGDGAPRLESAGSVDGVKRGVANRDVIGVLPDYAVAEEIAEHTLIPLAIDDPPPLMALTLTTAQPPQAGAPLDALIRHVRDALPQECSPTT